MFHAIPVLEMSVHATYFHRAIEREKFLKLVYSIQGFWQVAEKKVKFCGIFRDKFTEKSTDFAGIFWGKLCWETLDKKSPMSREFSEGKFS